MNTSARIALAVLGMLVLIAVTAPAIAPYDPAAQPDIVLQKNLPPSLAHPFGTDSYSRDVLSRILHGTRTSLGIAGLAVLVALAVGVTVGSVAGMRGGLLDRVLMRGVDAVLSIPRILLPLIIAAAVGQLSLAALALVLGLTGWAGMSRLVRARVRELVSLDYIVAAHAVGVPSARVLVRHVLPGVAPQMLVAATLAVASVIPLEAGLSFLGLGVRTPTPSWGNILFEGVEQRFRAWWLLVFPCLAILVTTISVNVIAESLRRRLHPR
jgi:peptide/nickel transport system permease protein